MASRSSAAAGTTGLVVTGVTGGTADASTAKKTRKPVPKYFLGIVYGKSDPVVVISATQKAAHEALASLKPATPQDVVKALQAGNAVLDTTAAAQNTASCGVR